MSRLIFVPQLPSKMRYQEWWFTEIPKNLNDHFEDIVILGKNFKFKNLRQDSASFSLVNEAIDFELYQIREYMNMKLYSDDVMFCADLSFPGIFMSCLFHKKPCKLYSFCHATSANRYDYYSEHFPKKFTHESSYAKFCHKVFVATEYHRNKLEREGYSIYPFNIEVTSMPLPPFKGKKYKKDIDFISVARPTKQKLDIDLENALEKKLNCKIYRGNYKSWSEYYKTIARSKIMIITSSEETFGYQVIDAILNNCIPIAPNCFSYPELIDSKYLYKYKDLDDMIAKIESVEKKERTNIRCEEQMKNFYINILKHMEV